MNQEQMEEMFSALMESFENVSPQLARAQKEYYDALVDEGFTEEQAFELVKESDVDVSSD